MAHMYTTSRGKNKKSKESVRKDHSQNQERKLKTAAVDRTGWAQQSKDPTGIFGGHLMGGGATGVSSSQTKIKVNPNPAPLLLRESCSNSSCPKKAGDPGVVLRACSVCSSVKYCSRDCQVADWKNGHGKRCKELKNELQALEEDDDEDEDDGGKAEGLKEAAGQTVIEKSTESEESS